MRIVHKIMAAVGSAGLIATLVAAPVAAASVAGTNFESYNTTSPINGQDGWSATGAAGMGCANYDQRFVSNVGATYNYSKFGNKSLRISDAVTSGCFSDQVFAKPLADAVGETAATSGTFSAGTKQRHFAMQFDIAAASPTAQPGLRMSVSPDRGDGSRMSYLRFEDGLAGLDVFFDDVQGAGANANFVETKIAAGLDRTKVHNVKLTLDAVDGPSNDVVKVWIDGQQKMTGTSWENYYRFDPESAAEQSPRIVKTILFRSSGAATPANAGKGFLFDNLSYSSGPQPPTAVTQCLGTNWKTFNDPAFGGSLDCILFVANNVVSNISVKLNVKLNVNLHLL